MKITIRNDINDFSEESMDGFDICKLMNIASMDADTLLDVVADAVIDDIPEAEAAAAAAAADTGHDSVAIHRYQQQLQEPKRSQLEQLQQHIDGEADEDVDADADGTTAPLRGPFRPSGRGAYGKRPPVSGKVLPGQVLRPDYGNDSDEEQAEEEEEYDDDDDDDCVVAAWPMRKPALKRVHADIEDSDSEGDDSAQSSDDSDDSDNSDDDDAALMIQPRKRRVWTPTVQNDSGYGQSVVIDLDSDSSR